MEVDKKDVGSRIKKIRLDLGEKTEDFGKHFDPIANRSLVSAWENGRYLPNAERLKKISELGNVSVDYLLYGYPEMYIFSNFENLVPEGKEYLISITDIGQISQIAKAIYERKIPLSNFSAVRNVFNEFIPEIEENFLKKFDGYIKSVLDKPDYVDDMLEYLKKDFVMAKHFKIFTCSKDFLNHVKSLNSKSLKEKVEFFTLLEGYVDSYDHVIKEGFLKETYAEYFMYWDDFLSYVNVSKNKKFNNGPQERIVYRNSLELPHFKESILVSVSDYDNKLLLLPIYKEDVIVKHFIEKKCFVLIDEKPYIGFLTSATSITEERTNEAIDISNKHFIAPILVEFN